MLHSIVGAGTVGQAIGQLAVDMIFSNPDERPPKVVMSVRWPSSSRAPLKESPVIELQVRRDQSGRVAA